MAAERVTMDCLMEEQRAAQELAQAAELKAERDRWAAAVEASERQITHLTDKAAALENPRVLVALQAGGLGPSLQSGGHKCTGDGNGDPGSKGGNPGHADTGSDLPRLHHGSG